MSSGHWPGCQISVSYTRVRTSPLVNLTLSDGSIVDLVEINVTKGCAKLSDFEDHFTNSRKCWTSNVKEQHASLKNHG